jgi:uncharacterized protein YbbC (DUF1343 family)
VNRILIILSFLFLSANCSVSQTPEMNPGLILGAEKIDVLLPILQGKRVAMLVNHTSLLNETHLVDTLLAHKINIVRVFAPEHGFRGDADAGETVKSGIDTRTGLPIVSLYGQNKKPTPEQVKDIDIVLFDIQDVGTRFYTYISSMHYAMEACAENNKQMVVLDRPNPNGMYVDGPVLDMKFKSFVGMHPIPVLHGLTVGELARLINGERWLDGERTCDLTVIEMSGYTHDMEYSLPVKPSPNLPNDLSIKLYPSLCLFEGTEISVGRGTYSPFQQIGHPSLVEFEHSFTPESLEGMAKYPPFEGETCYGTLFTEDNILHGFDLSYLIQYYEAFEDKDSYFNAYFPKLAGNDLLSEQIKNGVSEAEIRTSWEPQLTNFKELRKKYLLYP